MKQSINDRAVDIIKKSLQSVTAIIRQEDKGTRPFRFSPPPERERLFRYLQKTPEQKEEARQDFGEAYDVYEQEMEALKKKYGAEEAL